MKTLDEQIGDAMHDDPNKRRTYTVSCVCTNCGHESTGTFTKGIMVTFERCPNCECWTLRPKW